MVITDFIDGKIDRTTTSITDNEVLGRFEVMQVSELGTMYSSSLRLCDDSQTVFPCIVVRS